MSTENRIADTITIALKSGDPVVPLELARKIIGVVDEPSAYDDVQLTRMLVEGVAWLTGYACARRGCSLGVTGAAAEADQVADHFAARFGVGR